MPSDLVSQFPKVPVIGLQPTKVSICGVVTSMTILCDCGSPVPVIIPNMDRAGICMTCKTKYVISKLKFENVNGNVSIEQQVAKWGGPMSASPDLDVH